ncbi:hypothetical protein [Xanthobacter autotrophicus]|uniref:hypothetical protein n=1 Tax=Xanthobacter autotrophicus TaxID=280 RepID=UPI0037289451
MNAIDPAAPVGCYAIDNLAAGLFNGFTDDPVGLARKIVQRAAVQAWHEASRIVSEPEVYEEARSMMERLEMMERDCAAMERSEAWFAFYPKADDDEDPIWGQMRAADDIRQAAAAFRAAIAKFKDENFLGNKPSIGRARPLERAFAARFRALWREATGKPAPRSRSGPVVEFVSAAWADVGFPELPADDDTLAIYMGRLADD